MNSSKFLLTQIFKKWSILIILITFVIRGNGKPGCLKQRKEKIILMYKEYGKQCEARAEYAIFHLSSVQYFQDNNMTVPFIFHLVNIIEL